MTHRLSIALAQMNPTLGDIEGNLHRHRAMRAAAAARGADLVVFGELSVSGYPPEDLVLKPSFQAACRAAVEALAAETGDGGPALLVGTPWRENGKLHNAAALLANGTVAATRFKHDLPNYGVFDEKRVFAGAPPQGPVSFKGVRLGVMICEDMWSPEIAETHVESGAELLIVANGSPYEHDKQDERLGLAAQRVTETGLPLIYVNQVGGQDELVFDGASFVLGRDGLLKAQAPSFREHLGLVALEGGNEGWDCAPAEMVAAHHGIDAIYQAMVLGLRDYVGKNRFPGVLIGMSGGIDSALTAAVAVDALGSGKVWTVMMPSPFTSQVSLDDAASCSAALGVRLDTVSIEPAMAAFDEMLAPLFTGRAPDITEENIQARARGVTLMALSNKFGHMVLSTGNKSEMSVGYSTLYGDMCGGYSVLKDVYKTTVYALSRRRNEMLPEGALGPAGRVIPENIITRPPTAELKPDQTDQDSLPPYDQLDAILHGLIEEELSAQEIANRGHPPEIVHKVWRMLDIAEYKRRQAPPGVKITRRAFGRDRRYPITNAFRGRLPTGPT